ncbi:MAG TPA: hypothetical protein VGF55_30160 [Gemmataceae bacterium]|jgi:hypothetical protein
MGGRWRLRTVAGVLVLAAGLGCNPLTAPFFMMFGVDSKEEPEFKLASTDKNHEVRVVVLAYTSPDVQTDQVGVDRQLATELTRQLGDRCKANKEKVKVIPVHKVVKFKNDHPGWKSMGMDEIGRSFEADYVVDVEIVSLSLYEPGSHKTLFKGYCKVDVSVLDLSKPQDGPAYHQTISLQYPTSRGPVPVADDGNTESFRQNFVRRIATELAWKFTTHLTDENYQCD